jgi:transcriptional antiterminator NusG
MEAMGFSDQEEQLSNSAETSETGEIESAEVSAAHEAAAESPDSEVESSSEKLESPGTEESTEIDSTEAALASEEVVAVESAAEETTEINSTEAELTSTEPEIAPDEIVSEESAAEESTEIDSTEAALASEEVVADESAMADPDEDLPPDDIQNEQELDSQTELPPDAADSDQVESAPVADIVSDKPEKDSLDFDLSFLDEDQAGADETDEEGRSWYVVHCYSGYENKVRHNLEQRIETMGMKDMIFDIVVPTEEEIEVKEGKRRTVERRVFPGYILVNMLMTEESWYVVRNTPGVTGFVGMGNNPTPLRPEEVSQIIKRMEAEAPRIKVTFKSGERVRIVDGPFNDFRGTVSEIDMDRAKVRVMVNFFGRETPVELDFLQVEKT